MTFEIPCIIELRAYHIGVMFYKTDTFCMLQNLQQRKPKKTVQQICKTRYSANFGVDQLVDRKHKQAWVQNEITRKTNALALF